MQRQLIRPLIKTQILLLSSNYVLTLLSLIENSNICICFYYNTFLKR